MKLVVTHSQLLIALLVFCVWIWAETLWRRELYSRQRGKYKIPWVTERNKKSQEGSCFVAYGCFGGNVYSEIQLNKWTMPWKMQWAKLHSFVIIFFTVFLKSWYEASCVSHLELLVTSLCNMTCSPILCSFCFLRDLFFVFAVLLVFFE